MSRSSQIELDTVLRKAEIVLKLFPENTWMAMFEKIALSYGWYRDSLLHKLSVHYKSRETCRCTECYGEEPDYPAESFKTCFTCGELKRTVLSYLTEEEKEASGLDNGLFITLTGYYGGDHDNEILGWKPPQGDMCEECVKKLLNTFPLLEDVINNPTEKRAGYEQV